MTVEPVSPVPREARGYQGEVAGLVTRMVGSSIDAGVVALVLLAGWVGLNGFKFLLDPRGFQFSGASFLLTFTAACVVTVIYLTGGLGDHRPDLGQPRDGPAGRRPARAGGCVRRWRCCAACSARSSRSGWCGAAVNPSRRSVQDIVLRTSVVYDWVPRRALSPPPGPPTA